MSRKTVRMMAFSLLIGSGGFMGFRAALTEASRTADTVEPVTADRLLTLIRQSRAPLSLVNIWATWCPPCLEEFPELVQIGRDFKGHGVKLIFISADVEANLPAVQTFLEDQGIRSRSYVKVGPDSAFIDALSPEWSGAIPATFLFDSDGSLLRLHEGKGDYETFRVMLTEALIKLRDRRGP